MSLDMNTNQSENPSDEISLEPYNNKYKLVSEVLNDPEIPGLGKVLIVLMAIYTAGMVFLAKDSAAWWTHLMLTLVALITLGLVLKELRKSENKKQN